MARLSKMVLVVMLAACGTVANAGNDADTIKKKMEARFSDLKIERVKPTPVPGVYEIVFGTQIVYVSADGQYMFTGNLIDLETRKNLSTESRSELVKVSLEKLPDSTMIVFAPKKVRRTITVFTDVDCPYCARLHQEVPALNKAGVKVRYLLFPRAGKNSESYWRSVAVWCAKDRNAAIGIAKSGGKLEMKKCSNPVDEHMALGEQFGVTGTPTIIIDDGRILPGFVPAAEMTRLLGISDGPKAATSK